MTYSLSNNCTKNYYNRTLTVQVIVEDVVTWIFLKHSVFKHSRAPKRSWKIFHGVLESPGFFVSKRVVTLLQCFDIVGGEREGYRAFKDSSIDISVEVLLARPQFDCHRHHITSSLDMAKSRTA